MTEQAVPFQAARQKRKRPASQSPRGAFSIYDRGLVDARQNAGDQAGRNGDQHDVIAGMDVAVAARRGAQAIGVGIAHIVVAVAMGQVVSALPAVAVVARLDAVVAVARRVPVAAAGAAVVAEVVASAPPVAIVAVPALVATEVPAVLTAFLAEIAAIVATVLTEVAAVVVFAVAPVAAVVAAFLPELTAVVAAVFPIVAAAFAAVATVLGLGCQGAAVASTSPSTAALVKRFMITLQLGGRRRKTGSGPLVMRQRLSGRMNSP